MSIPDNTKRRIEAATVTVVKSTSTHGQAVYVGDGLFLTAAHCVPSLDPEVVALGDDVTLRFVCKEWEADLVLWAVDPVADIAVFGAHADKPASTEYDAWIETTDPVPLWTPPATMQPFSPFPVHILTHHRTWIDAVALAPMRWHPRVSAAGAAIEGGTSGGPVVDDAGRLVGIVASAGGEDSDHACPAQALPVHILRRIENHRR